MRDLVERKGFRFPQNPNFEKVDRVRIHCALPFLLMGHDIEVDATEDFSLLVNANAYGLVAKSVMRDAKSLAKLWYFNVDDIRQPLIVPERVLLGLQNYNWAGNLEKVTKMLDEREKALERGKKAGILGSRNPGGILN